MALLRANPDNIPEDAVVLTKEGALKFQINFLKKWKHQEDIWPINYGPTILASLSALSGVYINNYYRLRFRLFNHGKIASYLPICTLPAVLSFLLHTQFVLPDVILQENCAVCTEMRASSLQAGAGFVFPFVLAPFSLFSLALRFNTYDVPHLTKEPMKALQLWMKHTKPISNILFAMFVGQALAGITITYLEAKSIVKVNDKLTLLGYNLNNEE